MEGHRITRGSPADSRARFASRPNLTQTCPRRKQRHGTGVRAWSPHHGSTRVTGSWKSPLRLALIATLVAVAAVVLLAWLARSGPEKSTFFYDAR